MTWAKGQCSLSKFAHNTELRGVVCTVAGSADNQRPLDRLQKLITRDLMKFNEGKKQALHLETNSYTSEQTAADHLFRGDSKCLGGPWLDSQHATCNMPL